MANPRRRSSVVKKDIRVVPVPGHLHLHKIVFYPGGEVPANWKDHYFTDRREAQKEIDRYLSK